jgi:DNA-directed RNA polymerase subunit RPC12/RpoP
MEEIFCIRCGKLETAEEKLTTILSESLWSPKYLCQTCVKDLGGIEDGKQWIEDKFGATIHSTS